MKHKTNIPAALRTTGSSSLVKIKGCVEGILISLFLKDNAPTAKETFHTQDMLVSVNKIKEYKGDSI